MFVIVMVNVVTIYVCDCACSDIYVYVYVVTYMFVVVNVVTYMFVYAPMYICMYVRCACSDIACSVAGITSDANVLLAELRASAQRYRLSYGRPIPVEELVIQMCDVKHAYTQYGGLRPFGVSFLYAGWDPVHSLQLYLSDPSGNYSGWKATCIGYNASAAMALLKQEYPAGDAPQPTREQALDLAVRVLAKTMDTGKLTVDKVLFLLFRPVSFLSSLHTAYCILHSAYCILHTQSHYDTPLYSIPCVLCVVYCVVCWQMEMATVERVPTATATAEAEEGDPTERTRVHMLAPAELAALIGRHEQAEAKARAEAEKARAAAAKLSDK